MTDCPIISAPRPEALRASQLITLHPTSIRHHGSPQSPTPYIELSRSMKHRGRSIDRSTDLPASANAKSRYCSCKVSRDQGIFCCCSLWWTLTMRNNYWSRCSERVQTLLRLQVPAAEAAAWNRSTQKLFSVARSSRRKPKCPQTP